MELLSLNSLIDNPSIIVSLLGLSGTIVGYILGKNERKTKLKGSELDNMEHGLDIYKKIMDTLEVNLNAALSKLDDAQDDYIRLKEQMLYIEKKERECQASKIRLTEENLAFYRQIQTCPKSCKLYKDEK